MLLPRQLMKLARGARHYAGAERAASNVAPPRSSAMSLAVVRCRQEAVGGGTDPRVGWDKRSRRIETAEVSGDWSRCSLPQPSL